MCCGGGGVGGVTWLVMIPSFPSFDLYPLLFVSSFDLVCRRGENLRQP